MKILVINGPNLNFLGIRKPEVYGHASYADLVTYIEETCQDLPVDLDFFQSNHEGAVIDRLQKAYSNQVDGVLINPGAWTHYSYAIRDAIESVMIPSVEVHLSEIHQREGFRQVSVVKEVCLAQISGKGFEGYIEGIKKLLENKETI